MPDSSGKNGKRSMRCHVCPEYCVLRDGEVGPCGIRRAVGGRIRSLSFGGLARAWIRPIEASGFYHVLPGSRALCVSAGEGLPRIHLNAESLEDFSAQPSLTAPRYPICSSRGLVDQLRPEECPSLLFTQTEPSYFPEMLDAVFSMARQRGVVALMQSNGSMSQETIEMLAPVVDAVSLLVPTLRESTSRRLRAVAPHHLRDVMRYLVERGVWVEVSTVLFPGVNDSEVELNEIAHSISEVHRSIPWHLRRARPNQEAGSAPDVLRWGARLGEEMGLRNVYSCDARPKAHDLTFCHVCGDEVLIERGLGKVSSFLRDGDRCPRCSTRAHGLFRARGLQIVA